MGFVTGFCLNFKADCYKNAVNKRIILRSKYHLSVNQYRIAHLYPFFRSLIRNCISRIPDRSLRIFLLTFDYIYCIIQTYRIDVLKKIINGGDTK
ncbi:MAG: hypothetical protein E7493_07225 [Ruminococcus albus]|nr:hypothetical protein [Ruminococcus albus]